MIQIIKNNRINIWLLVILIFFLLTRLYKISEIPPSVYWDEASIGYNAYSIAQTLKDEWGDFLPLHFRAFGEFKLPVYIYSVVPVVKIFGLNEFSVRFPAVLFSLGVVILTYLLAKKLFESEMVGLFAAFFITISPWFFIFSRTGYEATAGLMFYLLAIYLFLHITKYGIFLLFSIISFILGAYSYNSFRIVAPLTVLILIIVKKENLVQIFRKSLHWVVLSFILLVISIWPVYRLYVYDAGLFRFQVVGSVDPKIFLKSYLSHYSLDFLLNGDKNLRHQQQGFGQLYPVELLLLPFSLLYAIGSKSKYKLIPLILVLISPIPAALTRESPHALRILSMIPFISMVTAMGVLSIKKYFPQKYLFESVFVIVLLAFFINYFINFINVYPKVASAHWQYGYKRIYTDYKDEFSKYDRIIISDEYAQPYIFALFHLKYDPEKFQKEVIRNSVDKWGFSTVAKFDKFEFGKIRNLMNSNLKNSLLFASADEKLPGTVPFDSIKFLDGSIAFWVYQL